MNADPIASRTASAAAAVQCVYCNSGEPHPQFSYLLSDKRLSPDQLMRQEQQTLSAWGYSRQPQWRLRCHNRDRRFKLGAKYSKEGAPNHQNELVIGPFSRHAAIFTKVLKSNNRKFRNRAARGVQLARVWHLLDRHQRNVQLQSFAVDEHRDMIKGLCSSAAAASKQLEEMVKASVRLLHKLDACTDQALAIHADATAQATAGASN